MWWDLPGLVQEVVMGLVLLWWLPLRQFYFLICLWRGQFQGQRPTKTALKRWLWRHNGQSNGGKLGKSKRHREHLVAALARQESSGGGN